MTTRRPVACSALAAVLLLAGTAWGQEAGGHIRLRYSTFDPAAAVPPVPASLAAARAGRLFIVQFRAPPTEAMRGRIRAAGGEIKRFLSDHAHVVLIDPARLDAVPAMDDVRWAGPYHPAYRLSPGALADALAGAGFGRVRYSIELMDRGAAPQQRLADRIAALGGILEHTNPDGYRIEASIDPAHLPALAALDDVNFIDHWGPPGSDMEFARLLNGAILLAGAGFSGQGVRGEVMDDGLYTAHLSFQNPPPLLHTASTTQAHGTAMYSIVFGNGAHNSAATGMLPGREQGIFASYAAVPNGYAHLAELVNPALPYRAVFQSNSWGSAMTTGYSTISAELDDALFRVDILACQSQGNSSSTASRPQAWAKNLISVGGFLANNTLTRVDDTASASSMGPAQDGRIKPDVVNLFDAVLAAGTSDPAATTSIGGTSTATAMTSGAMGLAFQLWHQGAWHGHGGGASVFDSRPHPSTVRALAINNAHQYNWLLGGPNSSLTRARQGWGAIDLATLYAARGATFVVDETDILTPAAPVKTYQLAVPPSQPALKITMVYADPMGNPASVRARINDLNLRVSAPGGAVYLGNAGLASGIWSATGGIPDTVNVVENVFVQNPAAGLWTVEVRADELVQDARLETPGLDADFALVVSGVVVPCYTNCDGSSVPPVLNVNDFICFQARYAAGDPYANCDGSTSAPILNVNDFICFQTRYAQGCP